MRTWWDAALNPLRKTRWHNNNTNTANTENFPQHGKLSCYDSRSGTMNRS